MIGKPAAPDVHLKAMMVLTQLRNVSREREGLIFSAVFWTFFRSLLH